MLENMGSRNGGKGQGKDGGKMGKDRTKVSEKSVLYSSPRMHSIDCLHYDHRFPLSKFGTESRLASLVITIVSILTDPCG